MSDFLKYPHLERFGLPEVEGIEIGETWVFPKLDGTNASVWRDNDTGALRFGSRNRELSLVSDNAGFMAIHHENENLLRYFHTMPNTVLYGEWLVPHSLKTYRSDAWKNFYVFDVWDKLTNRFIPYSGYSHILESFGIKMVEPICKVTNGDREKYLEIMTTKNFFLIEDGKGVGEGIVIKNYNWTNNRGDQVWAKMVTTSFMEKHKREMGIQNHEVSHLEKNIVDTFLLPEIVNKVYANLVVQNGGWTSKNIPELLNRCYYDLVKEETWSFVKAHKDPVIDFKKLRQFTYQRAKELLPTVFGG